MPHNIIRVSLLPPREFVFIPAHEVCQLVAPFIITSGNKSIYNFFSPSKFFFSSFYLLHSLTFRWLRLHQKISADYFTYGLLPSSYLYCILMFADEHAHIFYSCAFVFSSARSRKRHRRPCRHQRSSQPGRHPRCSFLCRTKLASWRIRYLRRGSVSI